MAQHAMYAPPAGALLVSVHPNLRTESNRGKITIRTMTAQEYLPQFLSSIEPFLELWQSVLVRSIAVKKSDTWVSIAMRIQLTEHPVQPAGAIKPTDYFLAGHHFSPIGRLDETLLRILDSGQVTIGDDCVTFADSQARLSWNPPRKLPNPQAFKEFGQARLTWALAAFGPRVVDYISEEQLEGVDSAVRLGDSGFSGVRGLASWSILGSGIGFGLYQSTQVEILAPVPFTLNFAHGDGFKGKLIVEAAKTSDLKQLLALILFDPFAPRVKWTPDPLKTEEVSSGLVRWIDEFQWPVASRSASFHLYYKEREVNTLSVPRWDVGSEVRRVLDDFFDPGGLILREWLFPRESGRNKPGGSEQTNFELAVARALNRCGIPTAWYGGKGYQRRPDLAAYVDWTDPPTVILGECTIQNPIAKLSGIQELCEELATKLGCGFQILPIVFTRVEVTRTDRQAARERSVYVMGSEELKQISHIASPRPALEYIKDLPNRLPQ